MPNPPILFHPISVCSEALHTCVMMPMERRATSRGLTNSFGVMEHDKGGLRTGGFTLLHYMAGSQNDFFFASLR